MKIWLAVLALIVSGCAELEKYPEVCQRCGYHYPYPGPISNEPPPLPKAPGGSDDEPLGTARVPRAQLQKAPPTEETLCNMRNVEICKRQLRAISCGDCFCAADGNLYRRVYKKKNYWDW